MLPETEDYIAFERPEIKGKGAFVLQVPKQCAYTITEALEIFAIALKDKNDARGASFWKKIEDLHKLPGRTSESMRSFWKLHSNKGLEQYLKNAIDNQTQYCHRFSEIPQSSEQNVNQGLEERIREAAENAPNDSDHEQTQKIAKPVLGSNF